MNNLSAVTAPHISERTYTQSRPRPWQRTRWFSSLSSWLAAPSPSLAKTCLGRQKCLSSDLQGSGRITLSITSHHENINTLLSRQQHILGDTATLLRSNVRAHWPVYSRPNARSCVLGLSGRSVQMASIRLSCTATREWPADISALDMFFHWSETGRRKIIEKLKTKRFYRLNAKNAQQLMRVPEFENTYRVYNSKTFLLWKGLDVFEHQPLVSL